MMRSFWLFTILVFSLSVLPLSGCNPPQVIVPDLAGLTMLEAMNTLSSAELNLGVSSQEFHLSIPIGRVIEQTPAAGMQVDADTTVDFVLSKGVEVPDLLGLTQSEAETALTNAGLTIGASTLHFHASAAVDTVFEQLPVAGTGIEAGSAIDVNVSRGNMLRVNIATAAELPDQDGFTWETAFATIQDAIDEAVSLGGAQVWVASGTYDEPRLDDANDGSLLMQSDVLLYGGFTVDDTKLADRDWETNVTTIDGTNGRGDGLAAYHVVKGADAATLDGFTITNGHAEGAALDQQMGGGMYNANVDPTVKNCTFINNSAVDSGGGMGNTNAASPEVTACIFTVNSAPNGGGIANVVNAAPTINACVFSENSVTLSGGGIYNNATSPQILRTTFILNTASYGGGISNHFSASPIITNCVFVENDVVINGGGIDNYDNASPIITNCTFSGNKAESGGGISNEAQCAPHITNSILWGNGTEIANVADKTIGSNPVVAYCCIQGGYAAGINIVLGDPLFVNTLRLDTGSSCIDTGSSDTTTYPELPHDDILGVVRPQGSGYDIGAYEMELTP